jgi:hypothetical protein
LFDNIPISEQELVDDMMSSDDTNPEDWKCKMNAS